MQPHRPLLSSLSFQRLVAALRRTNQTCVTVEQCCGGTISSSILAQPGASAVFYGGTTAYNSRKSKPLLLNDDSLHRQLLNTASRSKNDNESSEAERYIRSKMDWTAQTSVAFCRELETDFAIAEGGASGPTFRPNDLTTGFAVLAVAGRLPDGSVSLLRQEVVRSDHADRERNMRLFADKAADLLTEVVTGEPIATIKDGDNNSSSTDNNDMPQPAQALQLDRATHLRSDPEALAALEHVDAAVRYVILRGDRILVQSPTELALLNRNEMEQVVEHQETRKTFLGILTQEPKHAVFGIDLLSDDDTHDTTTTSTTNLSLVDTRTTAPLFTAPIHHELALHATALAQWQRRTAHCSRCGGAIAFVDAGTCSQCTACRAKSWPRQDPSVIAVVSSRDGRRVLLARSPRHPGRLHTVLAGFVEAGETLEAAVARECFEETRVPIDEGSVRYVGSQPWPFPQSCMIGFAATADDDDAALQIDGQEIVSAAWFDRPDVRRAAAVEGATMQKAVAEAAIARDPSLPLLIPPKGVIARRLIDLWLDGDFFANR